MKIVQTNKAYYPKVGGIETTITTLSEGLVNNYGAEIKSLVCNEKICYKTINEMLNGVDVQYLPTLGFVKSLPISPGYFKSLSKLKGDVLHIHEPFPLADLSLAFISKIKKNFSHIVVSWHSDIIRQKWVLLFYRKYIHNLLKVADKIIVSNHSLIDNSEFLPAYKNKCVVIPIGVNLNWAKSESIYLNHQKDVSLLFVGRLVYYKGINILIDSMTSVKNATLTIIGNGPLKDQILSQIKKLKLSERINIIPEADEETLHSYYKNCDLLILPSVEKSETYGIVQIEAMACGKPVICTDLGTGTTFINQHNVTGIVVPPKDSKALGVAINKLVSNADLRISLGKNAKERAFSEFTSDLMVKRIYELYSNILDK